MKRTPLKRSCKPLKMEIQAKVRLIVTLRDKGCILRDYRCGVTAEVVEDKVVANDVIQADHLITRANSATYADTRLIVCLCRGCHLWKKYHQKQYDALVKTILPKERVELWERCERDSWRPTHKGTYDWKLELLALDQEYQNLLEQLSKQ